MALPARFRSLLATTGQLVSAENEPSLKMLARSVDQFVATPVERGTLWRLPNDLARLQLLETPTGHAALYGEHGQRILYLDPGGTLLHECAWEARGERPARLLRARVQLDWGQWVGIKPEGLVNIACFDISKKPGWQRLKKDDLHRTAAQAMGVTPEEVAFFYGDDRLVLDANGNVTIRHKKDALYVLDEGRFDRTRFMACMGAMHWGQIDFLPVVELFQSLVAGTGSAVFELIRGLYDDQNTAGSPRLLRYRGIPTYPSPQAFQLFSTYFTPEAPAGADPFSLFMEPTRAAQVTWCPRPDAPNRFLDQGNRLSLTVAAGEVVKLTKRDDPTALPYTRGKGSRRVGATTELLQLQDGDCREELPLHREWGIVKSSPLPQFPAGQTTWRSLFSEAVPKLPVSDAYFAVPMYPEDDTMVGELATQPLAMEQILEYLEQIQPSRGGNSLEGLIDGWDAVIAECLEATGSTSCRVLYADPAFAQRQAQRLWDHLMASGTAGKSRIGFLPSDRRPTAYGYRYSFIFRWIPFQQYGQPTECEGALASIASSLEAGALAIVAGPWGLEQSALPGGFRCQAARRIAETAGLGMLRAILPKARINPDAGLFLFRKA